MSEVGKKIGSITFRNWVFFFCALSLACLIRICLFVIGFKDTVKFLSWFESEPKVKSRNDIHLYRKLISWTYHFSPLLNCLSICTTYWWLMKQRGINTQMKFGMAKADDKLLAHSWLECQGKLLSYEPNPRKKYIAFDKSILE